MLCLRYESVMLRLEKLNDLLLILLKSMSSMILESPLKPIQMLLGYATVLIFAKSEYSHFTLSPVLLIPLQDVNSPLFLSMRKSYFIVVLLCLSLIISDIEHLFM